MSELWRRGVVRPHTPDVARDIRAAEVDEDTPVDFLPIDDSLFSWLLACRLFDDLNVACGTMIDDYEEDELSGDVLTAGIEVIERHAAAEGSSQSRLFLRSLSTLAKTASDTETPIIFIL